MKTRWLAFVGLLLLTAMLWISLLHGLESPVIDVAAKTSEPAATAPSPAISKKPAQATPDSASDLAEANLPPAVPVRIQRPAAAVAAQLTSAPEPAPGLTPMIVLQNMRSAVRQYSLRFGGNPSGNNLEITAALNGKNARQTVFINPDDGLRVNDRGELIDNWDTPFFFHQVSATVMEIYSAGPDRKMWTSDDLVIQ
jgi:hypothetical protein